MPSLTVLCGLCVVDVRLRLLLVLVLGRRVCRVIGLEGQVLLVGGACKNMKEGFYKYIVSKLHYETTFENLAKIRRMCPNLQHSSEDIST